MRKTSIPGIFANIKGLFRRYISRIAYYGCVAIALGVIAYAAEGYRADDGFENENLILPAAEIEIPVSKDNEPEIILAEGMVSLQGWTNKPRWNSYLGCWQTHAANDYSCADENVHAVCDGTVATVGESGVYGGFIEIEAGEYLVRYASVLADSQIHPGKEVKAGDYLGDAENGIPGEENMGPHLHLELYHNGENVDLAAYLSQNPVFVD